MGKCVDDILTHQYGENTRDIASQKCCSLLSYSVQ